MNSLPGRQQFLIGHRRLDQTGRSAHDGRRSDGPVRQVNRIVHAQYGADTVARRSASAAAAVAAAEADLIAADDAVRIALVRRQHHGDDDDQYGKHDNAQPVGGKTNQFESRVNRHHNSSAVNKRVSREMG